MTNKELDYIIQEGEGYLIEFKERVSASLAREITALANASGGRIFKRQTLSVLRRVLHPYGTELPENDQG